MVLRLALVLFGLKTQPLLCSEGLRGAQDGRARVAVSAFMRSCDHPLGSFCSGASATGCVEAPGLHIFWDFFSRMIPYWEAVL